MGTKTKNKPGTLKEFFSSFFSLKPAEKNAIQSGVSNMLASASGNPDDIQRLVLDASQCYPRNQALLEQYRRNNRNFLTRIWHNLNGDNARLVAAMSENHGAGIYAATVMIEQVKSRNLLSDEKLNEVCQRLSDFREEFDSEFETIYDTLCLFMEQNSVRQNQLEDDLCFVIKQMVALEERLTILETQPNIVSCPSCGNSILHGQLVCVKCGTVVEASFPRLENSANHDELSQYAQVISAIIKKAIQEEQDMKQYEWSKTAKRCAKKLLRIKNILTQNSQKLAVSSDLITKIDEAIGACANPEFQIALIGAIKAGKSTLMNAIAGSEIASADVNPETASLTKFRASRDAKNHLKVFFYKEDEWKKLLESASSGKKSSFIDEYKKSDADQIKEKYIGHVSHRETYDTIETMKADIKKWTSAQSPEHFFVKEVHVELASFPMPPEVVFVDTPGLDDPVAYRSVITQNYLKRADAVVVCIKADPLSGTNLDMLHDVFAVFSSDRARRNHVFVCATQCDNRNNPKEDWDKLKFKWCETLQGDSYFGDIASAQKNTISLAALFYLNLIQTPDIHAASERMQRQLISAMAKYVKVSISDSNAEKYAENFETLIQKTNIRYLISRLKEDIIDKRVEIRERDITERYEACAEALHAFTQRMIKEQNQKIITIQADISELKRARVRAESKRQSKQKELQDMRIGFRSLKTRIESIQRDLKTVINQAKPSGRI